MTDSSEMNASHAFLETPLQPRKSSTDMQERRRRYFRHVSVSLLQPETRRAQTSAPVGTCLAEGGVAVAVTSEV